MSILKYSILSNFDFAGKTPNYQVEQLRFDGKVME